MLDATRISTDEPDRDHALESPDFFDAKKFPTWTFSSTKIVPHGSNAFEMEGNSRFTASRDPNNCALPSAGRGDRPCYRANAQIDRHAFGMTVTRLDPTIGGTAEITLDVTLK